MNVIVRLCISLILNDTKLNFKELLAELDSGPLRSWFEWFVTYDQLEFFRESEYGKKE